MTLDYLLRRTLASLVIRRTLESLVGTVLVILGLRLAFEQH